MRVLIATSPGIGHIFPTVTTAAALRAAGHDVILATGGYHERAAQAGLHVVDTAPGVDFAPIFMGFRPDGGGPPDQIPGGQHGLDFAAQLFAQVSAPTADETVRLARAWRPDLVLHTSLQGVGPIAAAVVGVPAVVHSIGIGHRAELWNTLARYLAPEYERFGVAPVEPAAVLDVTPATMRAPDAEGWSMRYVPYNGGAVLPSWLFEAPARPRVTVTLGSVLPQMAGVGALRTFLASAGEVDAEFVLTLGGADRASLGEVPANVRTVDWVPLGPLLSTSAAVVHHGGAGSTLTSLDAGLPQLLLPHGADQFMNAQAVAESGAGEAVEPDKLDADRLTALLEDSAMRASAERVAAGMATQRTPADLVGDLIALAS